MSLNQYDPGDFFDELFLAKGQPRPEAALLVELINSLPPESFARRQQLAQNTSNYKFKRYHPIHNTNETITGG